MQCNEVVQKIISTSVFQIEEKLGPFQCLIYVMHLLEPGADLYFILFYLLTISVVHEF